MFTDIRRWLAWLVLGFCLWALCACGEQTSVLRGSIGEIFPLGFDKVKAIKQEDILRIEYLDEVDIGANKVCKLIVNTAGLSIGDNTMITGSLFFDRVGLERVYLDPVPFPEIEAGAIFFDALEFEHDGAVRGYFDVRFVTSHSIGGYFDATIHEIIIF